jgi:hypothetical protein
MSGTARIVINATHGALEGRVRNLIGLPALLVFASLLPSAGAQDSGVQTSFRVKYVVDGAVYLEGGRAQGLAEGQVLTVKHRVPGQTEQEIAEVQVGTVASTSAVCEIKSSTQEIQPGDMAFLSAHDLELLNVMRDSKESKKYPQVVSFSEGDPLDAELRSLVPHPASPEVNRARGRFGFEYNMIRGTGFSQDSISQAGFVLRTDISRIGGTYWSLSGYYRGQLNSRSTVTTQATLRDLVNRTYHLSLTYNNPESPWVAGFGRLCLPWASGLSTIDGGYFGRRLAKRVTAGFFGGSSPDPTSWNYSPDRQIFGSFVNFETGDYDGLRFTSTTGAAITRFQWAPDRQFGFFENGIFYKRTLSIYSDVEADLLRGPNATDGQGGPALTRSYTTLRYQPASLISFDLSHNYFRDMPTFDPRLISTGLVDKLLFQGFSGGVRLNLPFHLSPYFDLGRSSTSNDAKAAWNQMYGITASQIWRTGIHADLRYSTFNSTFGAGNYRSLQLSRNVTETFRFSVQAGEQNFAGSITGQTRSRWIDTNGDWLLGRHYFMGAGFTAYRGQVQNYNQLYLNLGYRFDMK